MPSHDYWQLSVYCGENASGNATGVVMPPTEWDTARCQRVAETLGHPDTVFLFATGEAAHWKAHAFSPAEELALCTQGMIAAYGVLRRNGAGQHLRFTTPSGPVTVEGDGAGRAWMHGPYRIAGPAPAVEFLPGGAGVLVDSGRTRLYREMADGAEFERLRLDPDVVLRFLREHKISGLCVYVRTGEAALRLRVFTTSLDGREDASTGGAVMVLPALMKPFQPGVVWSVEQGVGPRRRRGSLLARIVKEGAAAVGGRYTFTAEGRLLS